MKRAALMFLTVLAVPVKAQIEEDPREKMKEILERAAREMEEAKPSPEPDRA